MRRYLAGRAASVSCALRGIGLLVLQETNARVHAIATVTVLIAGAAFRIPPGEWAAVALAVTLVWVAEAVNTAFEMLCDVVSPDPHPGVARAKDVAAGAVLIAAFGAVAVGAVIFLPYLLALLEPR